MQTNCNDLVVLVNTVLLITVSAGEEVTGTKKKRVTEIFEK